MTERADVLSQPPGTAVADQTPLRPGSAVSAPQLDPDAAAQVASFGRVAPMRERGIEAVRGTLESAPRPEMAEMADIEDRLIPGRGRHSAADTPPVDGPIRARAGVLPRRRNGARDQPFLRAAGSPRPTPREPQSSRSNTAWPRNIPHPPSSTTPMPPQRWVLCSTPRKLGVDATRWR